MPIEEVEALLVQEACVQKLCKKTMVNVTSVNLTPGASQQNSTASAHPQANIAQSPNRDPAFFGFHGCGTDRVVVLTMAEDVLLELGSMSSLLQVRAYYCQLLSLIQPTVSTLNASGCSKFHCHGLLVTSTLTISSAALTKVSSIDGNFSTCHNILHITTTTPSHGCKFLFSQQSELVSWLGSLLSRNWWITEYPPRVLVDWQTAVLMVVVSIENSPKEFPSGSRRQSELTRNTPEKGHMTV